VEILHQYKEQHFPEAQPEDWVFPGERGQPMELGWFMKKYVRPLAEKLGIPQIHWHALRHLNSSIMLDEGVDVKTRMDRLGHVSDRVNMIYSHAGDAAQRAASELVWQKLKKAAAQPQTETEVVSLKVAGEVAECSRKVVSDVLTY